MGMQLAASPHDLLVGRVPTNDRDLNRDRLVGARRDDGPLPNLLGAGLALRLRRPLSRFTALPALRSAVAPSAHRRAAPAALAPGRPVRTPANARACGAAWARAPPRARQAQPALGLRAPPRRPQAPAFPLRPLPREPAPLPRGSAPRPRGPAPRRTLRLSLRSLAFLPRPLRPQFLVEVDAALACHGDQPRDVASRPGKRRGVLELAGRVTEAQVERLLASLLESLDQIMVVERVDFGALHSATPSRFTTFVLIGSLCPARRIASRARSSGTPASSNITRPGLTTATQPSGFPFPDPCRVSAGFFVYGLSGKMLIHTFPPRLILRVIATRAASIWRLVIQPRSSAFSPYSPNATWAPPFVLPRMRPRMTLRCLTRFGISIRQNPPWAWEPRRSRAARAPVPRE